MTQYTERNQWPWPSTNMYQAVDSVGDTLVDYEWSELLLIWPTINLDTERDQTA